MQSGGLTPEKGELVGTLMGDKGTFKIQHRYGIYNGYDLSKYARCAMSVCLGIDRDWGDHLAGLMMRSYGVHGSTYLDGPEWRFWCSSSRAFRDLARYYSPEWGSHNWRVSQELLGARTRVREGVVRGYFNADGYSNFSKARKQVSLKATSVNYCGLVSMKDLLRTVDYRAAVYRRYKARDVWELTICRQSDVLRFFHQIGFSVRRKQESFAGMLMMKGVLNQ